MTGRPVIWFEIPVTSLERAAHFYGELFGWRFGRVADIDREYLIIDAGESINGGLALVDDATPRGNGTLVYVAVEGLLETMHKASELGGQVAQDPQLISEQAGAFAVLRDPDGNRIGIWVP